MSRKIFISDEHQKEFDLRGYFIYQAFSENEISAIRHFYSLNDPGLYKDFYSSIESENEAYRIEVDTFLKSYFNPLIDHLMDRYVSLAATFIVKRGANSTIHDHTDDCLVDESEHTSVNMWSPLVDTSILNGAIRVLPGSHCIPNTQRGFGIPYRFEAFKEMYADRMILCPMKAGEVLVYDPRLIHNSYANLSGVDRPAIITGSIPQEAMPIVNFRYPGLPDDEFETFEVNTHFWHHFDKYNRPTEYRSLGIKKYTPTTITNEELLSYIV